MPPALADGGSLPLAPPGNFISTVVRTLKLFCPGLSLGHFSSCYHELDLAHLLFPFNITLFDDKLTDMKMVDSVCPNPSICCLPGNMTPKDHRY